MTQSELESKAVELLALSPSERLFLGERLVESVDSFASPEIAAAWSAEVAHRVTDYESGKVAGIPSADVHDEVRRAAAEHLVAHSLPPCKRPTG